MTRPQTLSRLRKSLGERRKTITRELADLEQREPLMSFGVDLAEQALVSEYEELRHTLAETERRELAWVEHALDRVHDGRYGVCERCGASISVWRLRAAPYATRCVHCQRQSETAKR